MVGSGPAMTTPPATRGTDVTLALLGAGFVADFYMKALAYVPHQRVVAVYSRTQERAEVFATRWGIPHATDRLDELIAQDGIDLYVVGLPTFVHRDACVCLAEAGRNVLCTKPLGRNAAEARAMLDAVRASGVRHGYLETEVFTPALVRAKELIDRGAIGEVVMVKSREAHFGSHSPYNWDPALAGGGPLLLLGSHNVEFSRFVLGKPRALEAFAWTATMVHQTPLEDTALMLIRFEGGKMAQVEVNWTTRSGLDLRNEITGTEGAIYTDITGQTGLRAFTLKDAGYVMEKAPVSTGWVQPVPEEPFTYGYVGHLKHFVDALRAGAPFAETFEDGYAVNAIIDAGYRSAKSGRWEPVE
jgi:predicted dehydrogenase